jgi:cyclic beta-1,2-glucan synthetase
VFGVAWALVAHTDSAFDTERLTRFVRAYQRVQSLSIGELWALAITLRVTLVENLRRLAEAIMAQQSASHLADSLAAQILDVIKGDPEPNHAILLSLDRAPWPTAFAVELAQRLRHHDPNRTPALRWLNDKLEGEQTTTDQLVHEEFQRQSATNVTVRNVITSMRLITMINWAEFFESVSAVDAVLRGASDFGAMDFPTRDLYRRAIEELARESGRAEVDVAERAILAGRRATDIADKGPAARREGDPGYYLIARGRNAFEKELGCRAPLKMRLVHFIASLGVISYAGLIAIVSAIILALVLFAVAYVGTGGWTLLVLAIVGLVPASDLAVAIVNRAIAEQVGGKLLPGLELRNGVTRDLRTIIVVPILLVGASEIEDQIDNRGGKPAWRLPWRALNQARRRNAGSRQEFSCSLGR